MIDQIIDYEIGFTFYKSSSFTGFCSGKSMMPISVFLLVLLFSLPTFILCGLATERPDQPLVTIYLLRDLSLQFLGFCEAKIAGLVDRRHVHGRQSLAVLVIMTCLSNHPSCSPALGLVNSSSISNSLVVIQPGPIIGHIAMIG